MALTATQRALFGAVQLGLAELKAPAAELGRVLTSIGARHGIPALRALYDREWDRRFAAKRSAIIAASMRRGVAARVERLQADAAAHGYGGTVSPQTTSRAVIETFDRPIGTLGWRYRDHWWPRDRWIKATFFGALQRGFAQREKLQRRRALLPEANDLRELRAATIKRPSIDPAHKKINYPITADLTDEELISRAADTVVVARGEYFAAVGLHDATRAADQALIRLVSGEIPQIGLWEWTLSPSHDPKKCSDTPLGPMCDALADADVGFGPGLYHDSKLPSSHVSCWCTWEASFLDPGEGEPEVPDDYEDRVQELMDSLGVDDIEMMGTAAGHGRATGCG